MHIKVSRNEIFNAWNKTLLTTTACWLSGNTVLTLVLNLLSWNSVLEISDLWLPLTPGDSLARWFTGRAQTLGRKTVHIYKWFFFYWLSRFFWFYPQGCKKKKKKDFYFVPQVSGILIKHNHETGETGGRPRMEPPFSPVDAKWTELPLCLRSHLPSLTPQPVCSASHPQGHPLPSQHPVAFWTSPQPASCWAGRGLFSSSPKRRKLLVPRGLSFSFCVCGGMFSLLETRKLNLPND